MYILNIRRHLPYICLRLQAAQFLHKKSDKLRFRVRVSALVGRLGSAVLGLELELRSGLVVRGR